MKLIGLVGFLTALFFSGFSQKDLTISGGNRVTSLVCDNRKVFVWGEINGTVTSTPVPVNIDGANDKEVKQVNSSSGSHFAAVDCDGYAWAWGNNNRGQVGTGATSAWVTNPTRVRVRAAGLVPAANRDGNFLVGVDVVYAANQNSYAILNNGTLAAWGGNSPGGAPAENNSGQLGNGNTTTDVYEADLVLTAAGTPLTGVTQVFGGDNFTLALVDPDGDGIGTVYSWGHSIAGTLGRNAAGTLNPATANTGGTGGATFSSPFARPVYYYDDTPMNNIVEIACGDVFGVARDVNNYVWTWGQGGFGNSTGQANNVSHIDPRRVVAGTTTGASNDGEFLLAKQIGGGQAIGVALTVDNKPVTWGGDDGTNCTFGGLSGQGDAGTSKVPGYVRFGAGAASVHDDVILVNTSDLGGYYGRQDGSVWAYGCNSFGQLGLGDLLPRLNADQITIPGCGFRDPPPTVNLTPGNSSVCSPVSTVLNSGFLVPANNKNFYTINWFRLPNTTTPVQTGTANNASSLTYTATDEGTYRVEVLYNQVSACVPYDTASAEVTLTIPVANFADPNDLEFCGTTSDVNVAESGSATTATNTYEWYTTPGIGTGTLLGTSTDEGVITIDPSALTFTGTAPNRIKTVYVEDVSSFTATHNTQLPGGTPGNNGLNDMNLTVTTPFSLNSVDARVFSNSGTNPISVEFTITRPGGGTTTHNGVAGVDNCGGLCAGLKTLVFTPAIEFNVAGNYNIEFTNGNNVASFQNGGVYPNDFSNGSVDIFSITGKTTRGDLASGFLALTNFDVTAGNPYPCGRVEVNLQEVCPACSQPTAITFNPTSVHDVCLGAALPPFNVSATTPGAALNTAFTISISKDGGAFSAPTGIGATDDPTATLPLTGNATAAQDGVYTVRIEDGNTGDAGCYFEADFELNVISPAVPSTTALTDFCESTTPVPTWNATAATGYELRWHTAATGGGNATTRPAIPTSPTGTKNIWVSQRLTAAPNCQSARVALDVDVLANPSAPGVVALEYCRNQTGVPALTATGTNLQWYGTNATGGTGSGTAPTPSTATVATTSYYVTQSSSTTPACESPRAQLDVTINAAPSAPGVAALEYCKDETGVPALTATGTNLQWYGTDATGGTGSGTAPTPSTATAGMASYYVTQSSTGPPACESPRAKLDVTINALPTAVLSGTETVCIGGNADLTVTVTGGTGPYNFTYDSPSTTGVAVSGATSPYALNVSTVGNYSLSSLVDAKGCAATAASLTGSGSLDTIPRLVVTPANDVCNFTTKNYTIDLAISGGSPTYTVTGMGETTTGLSAGTHTTTAVDGSNAGGSQSYSYTITDNSGCTGTEYTQTITGTKNCDCPVTGSIGLTTGSSAEICANETTSLTVTLGNGTTPPYDFELLKDGVLETTYTGETGPVTIGGINETATYTIANVKDGQCTGSASGSVGIDVFPIPVVTISSDFTEVCEQGTPDRIVITATVTPATSKGVNEMTIFRDGISAKFESTPLQSFSQLSYVADRPSKSGSYTATANNQVCPVSSISSPVDAKVWGQPQILAITAQDETQAIPDTVTVPAIIRRSIKKGTMKDIGVGAIMFPQVGDDNYTYFWTTAEPANEDVIKFGASKNANIHLEEELIEDIILEVTNGLCVERKEYLLQVLYPLFVPNAFSPNGDGTNDFWEISGLADFPSAVVSVFNRWGNKLYEEKNYSEANAWDGENSPVGTYYYIIKLNKEGWETPLTGAVTITR